MRQIVVFCGTKPGRQPVYREAAWAFGQVLLRRGLGLVYGGSTGGLMEELATTVLAGGGEVLGVVTERMHTKGVVLPGLTRIETVQEFPERKALFAKLGDAFVALPGGYGTFDEIIEIVARTQVGLLDKPCGLLNVAGYFDPLIALRDRAIDEGFVQEHHRPIIEIHEDPDTLLDLCLAFVPPPVSPQNQPPSPDRGGAAG